MMKPVYILLFGALLMSSCGDETEDPPVNGVNLRIQNSSGLIFDDIYVGSSGEAQTYDLLLPGQTSDYKPFNILYTYSYMEIAVGEREYVLQPIDYFGETPLPEGNYTYVISVTDPDSKFGISLEFRED